MGIFDVFKEKCDCVICGNAGRKIFMYEIADGKSCDDGYNKLGKDKQCSKYTLNQALDIMDQRQILIKLADNDFLFEDKVGFKDSLKEAIHGAKKLKTDLLEADYPEPASKMEAIFRGRIYSISGKDKRFPILPEKEVESTRLEFYPFSYGHSQPSYCKPSQAISYSNRPYIDDRDDNEKVEYGKIVQETLRKNILQDEFKWITKNLPEMAPKSLSGYSRMKNSNSKNFQKIQQAAAKLGKTII